MGILRWIAGVFGLAGEQYTTAEKVAGYVDAQRMRGWSARALPGQEHHAEGFDPKALASIAAELDDRVPYWRKKYSNSIPAGVSHLIFLLNKAEADVVEFSKERDTANFYVEQLELALTLALGRAKKVHHVDKH